jgi:hypothetical protein
MHFTVDVNVNLLLPDKLLQFLEGYQPTKAEAKEDKEKSIVFESVGDLASFSETQGDNQLSIINEPKNIRRKPEELDKLFESHKKIALAFIYKRTAFELKDVMGEDYKNGRLRIKLTKWLLTQTDHVERKITHLGFRRGVQYIYYPFWYENRVKIYADAPNLDKPQTVRGATWRALGPRPEVDHDENDPYINDAREA